MYVPCTITSTAREVNVEVLLISRINTFEPFTHDCVMWAWVRPPIMWGKVEEERY